MIKCLIISEFILFILQVVETMVLPAKAKGVKTITKRPRIIANPEER